MAHKYIFGFPQGLFASTSDGYVNIKGTWYFANSAMAAAMLAVAADARRTGSPVFMIYEDTNDSIYSIQCL
jgi:hypothetical protein